MKLTARTILGEALRDFRRTWPQLILTDLLARVLSVVMLTPVVGLLLKVFLATTPTGVVTDGAIVGFLLHPTGSWPSWWSARSPWGSCSQRRASSWSSGSLPSRIGGVDGIISDKVALARQVQEIRVKLTAFGRLVIRMAGESGLLRGMEKSSARDDA
jgi:hypothetical protein